VIREGSLERKSSPQWKGFVKQRITKQKHIKTNNIINIAKKNIGFSFLINKTSFFHYFKTKTRLKTFVLKQSHTIQYRHISIGLKWTTIL